jgi:hypothetical protein
MEATHDSKVRWKRGSCSSCGWYTSDCCKYQPLWFHAGMLSLSGSEVRPVAKPLPCEPLPLVAQSPSR